MAKRKYSKGSQITFGPREKPGIWDEYLGQYIIVRKPAGGTVAGKLIGIKDDTYGILSPFQGLAYTPNGVRRKVCNGRYLSYLPGADIEPETQKNLENFCKFENKEFKRIREKNKNNNSNSANGNSPKNNPA